MIHSTKDIADEFRKKAEGERRVASVANKKGQKAEHEAAAGIWDQAAEFAESCEFEAPTPDLR